MKLRFRPAYLFLLSLLLLSILGGGAPLSPPITARAAQERIYFEPTGQYLDGKFLDYWRSHGGLPIFGYPLTPAFRENGYLTQYFERARFELHPENAGTDFEVLLGQLGAERIVSEGRTVPLPDNLPLAPGEIRFAETGYRVSNPFLAYWQSHGGLSQFGYPISPSLQDTSTNLTVQYFERARFELHPEYAGTDSEVLLTLLGVERASRLDPVLQATWPAPTASLIPTLHLNSPPNIYHPLDSISISSDTRGDLVVLGGDNRSYARYPISPDKPIHFTIAGASGEQSVVLLQEGVPVAALWGALDTVDPAWGIDAADPTWNDLYNRVHAFLAADSVDYLAPDDITPVHGYRSPDNIAIWLRDHVYQSKGFKYFDSNMTSALDYFRSTQRADGSFDDYLYHEIATPIFKDQIEVEPDREFLFVDGVYTAWQANGDDKWLSANLNAMERGMAHLWGDPKRWSSEYGLIKRAFTIDTWDFEQGSDMGNVRRYIDDKTRWSIMHGDNTGAYQAARTLASIERYLGREPQAQIWEGRAASLRENINKLAWNGNFYTHQIHLTPIDPTGVDESQQLSLSNAYALNRGTLSHEQAVALIKTYQSRRQQSIGKSLNEWYSIDPSFPLGFGPQGEYVNGGIMPLVGGELARGAFDNGFESYGLNTLQSYYNLIQRDNGSYLWYYPDGTPGKSSDQTLNTDGWGSSAMLSALTEGLAGIVDQTKLYQTVQLSPRWAAECTPNCVNKTYSASLQYPASNAYFSYKLTFAPDKTTLIWAGRETTKVNLHLLLPDNATPTTLQINNIQWTFTLTKIENSTYLDATLPGSGQLELK